MKVVKISPKGQITIPKNCRDKVKSEHYIFEMEGNIIILMPLKIKRSVRDKNVDELKNFGALAESSFDFWSDSADDIYQDFYR